MLLGEHDPQLSSTEEVERGVFMPVQVYPMFEVALGAANGRTLDEQRMRAASLWSRFSEVAAKNPNAWIQRSYTPEEIATYVKKSSKPIVVTIGDVGASGAYMVSSQATAIFANPGSAVGSIGVITEIPNVAGLLGKLGVYLSRWGEFLTDEPREANTEGGVWPALFGTLLMTVLMSLAVGPIGVIAAL